MTTLNISSNIREVVRALDGVARDQVPFATAVAITRTAKLLDTELRSTLTSVFDNPTAYITRSTFSTSAKKNDLNATVGIRDQATRGASPAQYVRESFTGKSRGLKPYEVALQAAGALPQGMRAVPGVGLKLDRFGNPDRKQITEILGALRRRIAVFSGRGKRVTRIAYFIRNPGDMRPQARHLAPGVWRRIERDAVIPVFLFVKDASYSRVIDLPAIAGRVITTRFSDEFGKALANAVRTAR